MNKRYQAYHEDLIRLINRGGATKKELILTLFWAKVTSIKRAKSIIESYKIAKPDHLSLSKSTYQIPLYQGKNQFVLRLMHELNSSEIKSELLGAYVHGSLATEEEIKYSDFDALVILKDSAFENPNQLAQVCRKLNQLSRLFYQYDPLQHHGWFVLTESMLDRFPQTYFPPILFEKSKSLIKGQGNKIEVKIPPENETDFEQPFYQLAAALKRHLHSRLKDKNAFVLKSIFSQFMLMPSLYLQAKNKKGIYKKYSFNIAADNFSNRDWEIMDKVSKIRMEWDYKINPVQQIILTSDKYLIRKVGCKLAPKINTDILMKLDDSFYVEMSELVRLMTKKIEACNEKL